MVLDRKGLFGKTVCSLLLLVSICLSPVLLFGGGSGESAGSLEALGSGEAAESRETRGNREPLKIGILPDLDSVPLVMARELGFFDAEEVRVELVPFKNPVNRDGALQSGAIDGAVSDLLAAAFAADGGFELKALSKTDGSYKLLGSGPNGVDSMEQLEGGEVALSRNTIIEYSTDRILEAVGLDGDYIKKVSIPQIPVRLEMLKSGALDGATLPEPLASVAIAGGAHILGSSEALGINPGVLLFSAEAIRLKQKALIRFFQAYDRTVAWLEEEPDKELRSRVVEAAGFPAPAVDVLQLPRYTRAQLPLEKEVTEVMEWLKKGSLIEGDYRYQDLVDRSIIDTLREVLPSSK